MTGTAGGRHASEPTGGAACGPFFLVKLGGAQAQLAQLKELQAELDEQRRQTQELCTALEQQRTTHGAHAQAAARVARERILADDNIDKPLELKTAGEKLVAAAYLLQAMLEPSTTLGRNLRREAQALIEQAAVQ